MFFDETREWQQGHTKRVVAWPAGEFSFNIVPVTTRLCFSLEEAFIAAIYPLGAPSATAYRHHTLSLHVDAHSWCLIPILTMATNIPANNPTDDPTDDQTNDPANNQDQPRPPPTKLARKYGVYKNPDRPSTVGMLQGYKSGLTPTSPYRADESTMRTMWKELIGTWQYYEFRGFPVPWIRALRAYLPTADDDFAGDWTVAQLANPIHPLIGYAQWETLDNCLKNYPPPVIDNERGFMHVSVLLAVEMIISETKYDTG